MASVMASIRVADLPIGKALADEHRAVHAYVLARLLLVEPDTEHKAYSDLVEAHDKVADLIRDATEDTDR